MEQSFKDTNYLLEKNIVEENERLIEIYKITCSENNKSYVGQAVTHILNAGKYRRYGMEKRLRSHISEAFSNKKHQCHYLNNSIRKNGGDKFDVKLLEICSVKDSDNRESYYIEKENTMFPNGYNLKLGTITTRLSKEGRKRVSDGVARYYEEQKYSRFLDIKIPDNTNNCIRPLNRKGVQYGWYVYIHSKKADFGGIHISLEESRIRAENFIIVLKERYIAKHLVAGNP